MLRRFVNPTRIIARNVSALYVTGDKAMENFAVLTPFLEIDERMRNFEKIRENIARRKLRMNLSELRTEYELFAAVESRKKELEARRVEIAALMRKEASEALKLEARNLRENLKELKENSYHLEDQFVHHFLKIPTDLHRKTPAGKETIYEFLDTPPSSPDESASDNVRELIEYFDPTCYYMKGEAAKFDLQVALDVCDYYRDSAKFVKFSNPDFVRSIVPEAAGVNASDIYLLKEIDIENKLNLLHLTGSASMTNFLPFLAKLIVYPTQLPLKFICTGRNFDARNHHADRDLYNVVQTTCCQNFIAALDHTSFDEIIGGQIEHWKRILERFNQHFRIVSNPPEALAISEAYKLSVEMYAPSRREYVEIANFSYHSDFISKRLLFNYKLDKATQFPHIYSGAVLNVTKLLVILAERGVDLSKFTEN